MQQSQRNIQGIPKGDQISDNNYTENILPKINSELIQQAAIQILASKSPTISSIQPTISTVTPKSSNGNETGQGKIFDNILAVFHEDLTESSDIKDGCDSELIDLRVKLCVSENIALQLHVAFDDILEETNIILDEAKEAGQSLDD